jgi:hypothetical protein
MTKRNYIKHPCDLKMALKASKSAQLERQGLATVRTSEHPASAAGPSPPISQEPALSGSRPELPTIVSGFGSV